MPKILVIGDLMMDHYIWGSCERISPEAPVQVVLKNSESKRLGGCGNVISNLIALGADTGVISVLGDDETGRQISKLLDECGAKSELVLKERGRKSSQKSRIIVSHQQVLRLDTESVQEITLSDEIIAKFPQILKNYDIVLLSDYAKGVLSQHLCTQIIKITKDASKLVLVDPKGKDYSKYWGATLLTPNRKEASQALNRVLKDDESIKWALKQLKERYGLKYGLITLSEQGIGLYDGQDFSQYEALAKEVFDVTGAGDSVLATLGYCLADGFSISQAIQTANLAAAVVVGKVGSADASWSEINALKSQKNGFLRKIITQNELKHIKNGKKIIFTNGCFDILHFGHISYLEKAKNLGDILVVGLNTDRSIKALKGEQRPINSQNDRAAMLAALECVDFVVLFDDDTPLNLIKELQPDILVKGADYAGKSVVGAEFAGEVRLIEFIEGKSTTNLIKKIQNEC